MTSNDGKRLQALFAAALDQPADARAAHLRSVCGDDPFLLRELQELLDADARLSGMTARPALASLDPALASLAQDSLRGMRIGPFELREELGQGGMGRVYRAERVDGTVEQHVAVKFVRRELLDGETLRRFRLERELMARLDHPHIARLIDAADLADGTPYYVMELVSGSPITDHCAQLKLGLRERIALFRKVCAAVGEAHHELIVHRDLKPSNILISESGVPKLLDFGIAKPLVAGIDAVGGDATAVGRRFFSPYYAAPELITGRAAGIACDVYALGVLLYELLTGRGPFDFDGLTAGQIERLITDVPPPAPSVALARHTDGAAVHPQQLRGDLDGIVLRCLRKNPGERYPSVDHLEADLANYLEGRPILERGGHRWYRVRKFVRRNAVWVTAGVLTMGVLVAGLAAFAWQAEVAKRRAAELQQVSRFQAEMLAQLDPTTAGHLLAGDVLLKYEAALAKAGVSVGDRAARVSSFRDEWNLLNSTDVARDLVDTTILKPAVAAVATQFADQPVLDATLSQVLAVRYRTMGLWDAAQTLQQHALEVRRRVLGDDHPDTIESVGETAALLASQGKRREALPLFEEALARSRRVLGEEHPKTLLALSNVGLGLSLLSRFDEAEWYYRAALEGRRRVLGNDDPDTVTSVSNLANLLLWKGNPDDAEPLLLHVVEVRRRVLGSEHRFTMSAVSSMTGLRLAQGRLDEAEAYAREALNMRRRALGEAHPDTLSATTNLALMLNEQLKGNEAEPLLREVIEKRMQTVGGNSPSTIRARAGLGVALFRQGRLVDARAELQGAIATFQQVLGNENIETLRAIASLGTVLVAEGRHSEAVDLLESAERPARSIFVGTNGRPLAELLAGLGRARAALGDYSSAEKVLLEAHELHKSLPSPRPHDVDAAARAITELYAAWNTSEPTGGHVERSAAWNRSRSRPARSR